MSDHILKHPDKVERLSSRDFIRTHGANGMEGFVVEDIDLLIRFFGRNYNSDSIGKCIMIELKYGTAMMGVAQKRTFGLLDSILRIGDPNGLRYLGFYKVSYDNEDWEKSRFWINGKHWKRDRFLKFLKGEARPAPIKPWNYSPEELFPGNEQGGSDKVLTKSDIEDIVTKMCVMENSINDLIRLTKLGNFRGELGSMEQVPLFQTNGHK